MPVHRRCADNFQRLLPHYLPVARLGVPPRVQKWNALEFASFAPAWFLTVSRVFLAEAGCRARLLGSLVAVDKDVETENERKKKKSARLSTVCDVALVRITLSHTDDSLRLCCACGEAVGEGV